ncbi:outer membrane lipoprotein Blc [Acerihabitans arboris]|uniref:Outer membrane lipoprotein Blc n=1 Tax=Acerihabitans arboris TaxID=2691583 RepID=A0A845SJE3_9GAMM|nr:outer membrane lipoprotein Blc [Acerihabitans arboris]NDL61455.1 outer membrane lipoprotein Blc [Acerihabitans arboris]
MSVWKTAALVASSLLSLSCSVSPPSGVKPVQNFNVNRYLGTWHEIARLDHRFERGLDHVTAHYSLRDDGGVNVINKGFSPAKQRWQQSNGKAYFLDSPRQASLKVSFFGPFYGGYHVIELDAQYGYALVSGPNRDYLWILARGKTLPEATRAHLVDTARRQGFPVDHLIWVDQS